MKVNLKVLVLELLKKENHERQVKAIQMRICKETHWICLKARERGWVCASPGIKPQQDIVIVAASRFSNDYGGLNENVSHRFRCLKTWWPVVGVISKGSGDMALLEEVSHWRRALRVWETHTTFDSFCFTACNLSRSLSTCGSSRQVLLCHRGHLPLRNHKPKLNTFFWNALAMVFYHSHRKITNIVPNMISTR